MLIPPILTLLTIGLPSLRRLSSLIPTLWSMLMLKSDWPSSGMFMMYVPNAKTVAARTYAKKYISYPRYHRDNINLCISSFMVNFLI